MHKQTSDRRSELLWLLKQGDLSEEYRDFIEEELAEMQ